MNDLKRDDNSESLREALIGLLENFKEELKSSHLRDKVLALVPAHDLLRKIGASLIPKEDASAARDRILFYLRKYSQIVVNGKELMIVAGIGEWARRLRELRVQFGWSIVNGETAWEMLEAGEDLGADKEEVREMKPDDYILFDDRQDEHAAFRWHSANDLRKAKQGIREKILEYLRKNVGKPVTGEELRYVANDKSEWARRVRELRTELGWPISTKNSGRPDLPVGAYVLEVDRQSPPHDRTIPDAVRSAVLLRDNYKCANCGWSHEVWNPSDPRGLEPHHVKPHAEGGENVESNLITLCTVCHDKRHADMKRAGEKEA